MSETQDAIANSISKKIRAEIPNSASISAEALLKVISRKELSLEILHTHASEVISEVQIEAYNIYLEKEARVAGDEIADAIAKESPEDALTFIRNNFRIFDRICLSLSQSRRSRAGSAFEAIVAEIFDRMGCPYTPQPVIHGGQPDYIMPSLDHYKSYPSDCIVFTCKRTLRERWRQIVTEGVTGNFFLATIDGKISENQLNEMRGRRVTLIVPEEIKNIVYVNAPNVITFEHFFEHHLTPALNRWKASGII